LPQAISGINAVKENLRQGKKSISELLVARGKDTGRLKEILDMAGKQGIPIRFRDRSHLDKLSPNFPHQGAIAVLDDYHYLSLEDLTETHTSSDRKGLLVAADHITDTGNLGSLIRTVEFFGVNGLILPRDRSASITDAVHKRSAGGSAFLPVARVINLARTLKQLSDKGFWIIGAAGESKTSIYEFDWDRSLVLVVGSESKGLSMAARKQCHDLVSIPKRGRLDSLNVSVAAGAILSEIVRQRGEKCM
jgi:23S rRNA (guanosine2251-2'-O)-methyltransferase